MIIGLTGGIASGKSTVAGMLRDLGAFIVDADLLAREVVLPGCPAWREIVAVFGEHILLPDNQLDRVALGQLVFNDTSLRERLEAIIHPHVYQRLGEETARLKHTLPQALVVHDIPLLLETGRTQGLEEIIVVYVPIDLQRQRLMARDNISEEQAWARINAQMPIEEKRRLGTIIIDNSRDLADTRRQVDAVYAQLARKSCQRPP